LWSPSKSARDTLISTIVSMPFPADRHHVGTPPIGQRHLANRKQILAIQQACDAPRDILRRKRSIGEAGGAGGCRKRSHPAVLE
jgi:hypothetical protein